MPTLSELRQQSQLPNQALIMAIMNVTPDSFSDGGLVFSSNDLETAVKQRAVKLLEQGADILDIGGESTRPGAAAVSLKEELARVIPAIKAIRSISDCFISIDTSQPEVMRQAVAAGANMINDVRALTVENALETAVALQVPVCVMHMQGTPLTMQQNPSYDEVVQHILDYLQARANAFLEAGGDQNHIIIDPGFGFGKTLAHNIALFKALPMLAENGYPVLVGVSRKSMLGQITGQPVEQRVTSSAVAAALAVKNKASLVRVHDVAESLGAIKVMTELG